MSLIRCGSNREPMPEPGPGKDRRSFLKQVCVGAAAMVSARMDGGSPQAQAAEAQPGPAKLPMIAIGRYRLTRLVAGSNPVAGYSHSTLNLANHMREFFTPERTMEYAERIQKAGINTWQSCCALKIRNTIKKLREQGCGLQWICLTSAQPMEPPLEEILSLKPIAIVHHGGVTDSQFMMKHPDKVHDFVKKVHDAGVMAGVSSHNPANVAYIEDKGWENEFFMTCLYYVTRPSKDIRDRLGTVPLGEPFLESDRDEMLAVVRQVKRPCLAFKILAAGRHCWSETAVESGFRAAFEGIKKTDGVIVGMYPKFSDEISHNAQLTMKYGMLA
jgi:hypothetical protein